MRAAAGPGTSGHGGRNQLVDRSDHRPSATDAGPGSGERPLRRRLLPTRAIQVALGAIWLADGALQLQPYMFSPPFLTVLIASNAQGQPGIIHDTIVALVLLAAPHHVIWNAAFALVQIAIGLGLLVSPRTVRPALVVSFAWALVVWWMGEGLGMLFMGTASPLTGAPGAVLLYIVIGLLVWPDWDVASAARDRAGRVLWAALWLLLAGLMFLPFNSGPNATRFTFAAAAAFMGSGPLAALDTALAGLTSGRGLVVSVVSAAIMAAVGVMVLIDWHRNLALVAGATIGVFLFLTSEFLGGILTGYGTDPNTGPLIVLFAALLWVSPLPATAAARLPPLRRATLALRHPGGVHHG